MRSLRFRLTLIYGLVTAIGLGLIAFALLQLAFEVRVAPVMADVNATVARVNAIVDAEPGASTITLLRRLEIDAAVGRARVFGPRGVHSLAGRPGMRGLDGPPDFPGPPGPQRASIQINVAQAAGLRAQRVVFRGTGVIVTPSRDVVAPIEREYLETASLLLLAVLVASFLIARWIAAQAVTPLLKVTEELRRFAAGDFRQRPVLVSADHELGDLIVAYNGATAQVAAAFRERQRAEEQMRRFVGDAGHELRTPLTAINGYVQLLQRGGYAVPAVRESAFRTLAKETARIRLLVERLVQLAKLSEPSLPTERAAVDVVAVVRDVVERVVSATSARIRLIAPGDALVAGDALEIDVAIANLVDNAVKYGGDAEVSVAVVIEVATLCVRVVDAGPGIPPEERAHVFERFFRGSHGAAIEGSGLGLAIAARAAERTGGTIVLERADPGETVFTLRLPAAAPPRAELQAHCTTG